MLTEEKEKNLCVCCRSSRNVYFDLLNAVSRLDAHLMDKEQQDWFRAFKQGLITALNRFDITTAVCCRGIKDERRN